MENNYSTFWGVDISKEWADIAVEGKVVRVNQTSKDIKAFIKTNLKSGDRVMAVMESTGGYERLMANILDSSGIAVRVAHPNRVRSFASALGCTAKTDKIDAKVLAKFGSFVGVDKFRPIPSKIQYKLGDLSSRLIQLKQMHHQESCRLGLVFCKEIKKSHKVILRILERELNKIEAEMLEIISKDSQLSKRYDLLLTMKGVGPKVALALIAELPELGEANKKEIAALLGVAPIVKDSGKSKGRAMTQDGRAATRKMLYMAALSAMRYDERMKEFYERLVARGKPKKVAIVAVMRKMIVIMNAMVANDQPYRPDCIAKNG